MALTSGLIYTATVTISLSLLVCTDAIAVMSIDLGSEWMKIAIVKPGVPMEIVLNKESRRKTPVVVSMRNEEREFGENALNVAVRYPNKAYFYLQELLGKTVDNPLVEIYKKRFPYYDIVSNENRNTVLFQHDSENRYSAEELLAMIFRKAKEYAESFADQSIKDAVITVPAYFNQAERRALLKAGELAGLRILQLMNSNTAVALHYGVFRRKDFNATAQYVMFYDMGAGSTVATIAQYQLVKTKEKGYVETNPQVSIKGIGFDRTLGGLEMQLRLRDFLAKLFNEQKKTPRDVTKDPRAMAKLFKEAGRLKRVLSANTEHYAQIEGLLDDKDFRALVTRAEFEELCEDLFARVADPVKDALSSSEMTLDEIDQIIIVGGNTRVPRVQQELMKAVKREELGKNVNADEAAALGAVYQAAYLSKNYRVKKFLVKDGTLYPVQVDFVREVKDGEEAQDGVKLVRRTLFGLYNPYPQKKVMTFNKRVKDFDFNVNYGDFSHLHRHDPRMFGSMNISHVKLAGVKSALQQHMVEKTESKGVKAHFRMDDSGILYLDGVESVFEKQPEEESTLSKLGSTISGLFGGKTKEDDESIKDDNSIPVVETSAEEDGKENKTEETTADKTEEETTTTSSAEDTTKTGTDDSDTAAGNEDGSKDKAKSEDGKEEESTKDNADDTGKKGEDMSKESKDEAEKKKEAAEKKPSKPVTIKEKLSVQETLLDMPDITDDIIYASKKKIQVLDDRDRTKALTEQAKNSLESFVFEMQDKINSAEYEKVSTEEEREYIKTQISAASNWMEEDGYDAIAEAYKDKLSGLQSATKDVDFRVKEQKLRPEAIQALNNMLNYSNYFLAGAKNLSDEQIFTEIEVTTLEKLINDTYLWNKTKSEEQSKTPSTVTPVLLISDIVEKVQHLDREVKYLLNKARITKPKKPTKTKANATDDATTTKDSKSEETETPSEGSTTTEAPDRSAEGEKSEDTESTDDIPELDYGTTAEPTTPTADGEESHTHSPEL